MADPVFRDGEVEGAVVVILDITEREERENLRREFTANVSHELKAPDLRFPGLRKSSKTALSRRRTSPVLPATSTWNPSG